VQFFRMKIIFFFIACSLLACGGNKDDNNESATIIPAGAVDITSVVLTNTGTRCSDFTGTYIATATDFSTKQSLTALFSVTFSDGNCTLTSNSVPSHDFNDNASFVTTVKEVEETFTLTAAPTEAASLTALSLEYDNGIFLNGVKLDLLAAACYGVGSEALGQEKIGCFQSANPWRYDPMFSGNDFGTDSHNAHTQPDGAYHYHGSPEALFDTTGASASSVIGFAADGFPIYGPFIDDAGTVRRVVSGYTLKSGERASQDGEGAFPAGSYDGSFRDDYEYTAAGDLDECNGMTRNGSYGYYVTNSFPWVLGCFKGTPNASFKKSG